MKSVATIARWTGALLIGLTVIAAPSLQAFLPQRVVVTDQTACGCGCGCSAEPVSTGCATESARTECGCSMAEPKTAPEAPLVAQTASSPQIDLAALPVDLVSRLEPTVAVSAFDAPLCASARRGPPLFVLNSSFLI